VILKVSALSRPQAVAGSMAGHLRESGAVSVQAIGAGAVNQAVKAMALARQYLAKDGLDLAAQPALTEVDVDGYVRTAVRFEVTVWPSPTATAR
jgi:stage V sporulation protein S